MNRKILTGLGLTLLSTATAFSSVYAADDFEVCKTKLSERAVSEGVPQHTADNVFANIDYQPRIIKLDRNQPEFVQTFPGFYRLP